MKLVLIFLLLGALVIPASASTVTSWTQTDISGHNLTLNYTSSFDVARDDTLAITIENVGNESLNDSITINEINVSDTSIARGNWTGSLIIEPNSSKTIDLSLNMITENEDDVNIDIYYNVSSENKTLNVEAHYPGVPEITSWSNNKSNNAFNLAINTTEIVRFNASADQPVNIWNWYVNNVRQSSNYDNFSTSWDAAGTKTVTVNATNANGTSNKITWTVTVVSPSGPAPYITSWSNSKTNNISLNITINESESVKFNFTANQTLTSWIWTLNGNSLDNPKDNLTRTFDSKGTQKIGASGSNLNGSTQTIVWNVTVLEKESKNESGKKNATLLSWSPQVVDYIYVNGTVNETIDYSITTAELMTTHNWSVDGIPVTGDADGNTYSHTQTWDNSSVGFHTVIFKGTNADTKVEFRWYVNVYEIGGYSGGSLFDVIDDALENHVTDIKIRMFKYKIEKHGNNKSAIIAQKVNQLHDEIAKRQMTREALRDEFKNGNITHENYTAALKQVQRDAKFNSQFAKEMAKIATDELKDVKSAKEFENISAAENKNKKEEKVTKAPPQDMSQSQGNQGNGQANGQGNGQGNNKNQQKSNNGKGNAK